MTGVMAHAAPLTSSETANLLAAAERLLSKRQLAPAQQACLQIVRHDKHHADAHFLLGIIAAELGRFGNAVEFIQRAIELDQKHADFHAHLGRCLSMLKRDPEARAAVDRALELEPRDALTLDTLGVVLSRLGEHEHAAGVFRRAIDADDRQPGYWFNLASSLKFLGDFDGAEAAYEAAIELSPRFYKAHSALSTLRRQTPQHNHIERLENLLPGARDVDAELHLRHALARECDDLGDYAAAFEHLRRGNARKRKAINYDGARDVALFERARELFDSEWLSRPRRGCDSAEPIFVIGMPRTGTTLVERIVSSHSQVFSAGELQTLPLAVKRLVATPSREVLDLPTLERAANIDPARLGRTYLDGTRPATGHTAHFVDKMPLNFFYVGLIHAALPNAKIVCLRRHPLDTCLSNFRQLFALRFSYYNYAYDLADIARYYVAFDALMRHWQEALPGKVLQVQYERLVAAQESETRRILDHCGLDFEDACLAFDRNAAPVATASSAQVREPMHAAAVARWKRYAQYLGPAQDVLREHGIHWDEG